MSHFDLQTLLSSPSLLSSSLLCTSLFLVLFFPLNFCCACLFATFRMYILLPTFCFYSHFLHFLLYIELYTWFYIVLTFFTSPLPYLSSPAGDVRLAGAFVLGSFCALCTSLVLVGYHTCSYTTHINSFLWPLCCISYKSFPCCIAISTLSSCVDPITRTKLYTYATLYACTSEFDCNRRTKITFLMELCD